jgi:hypothetical protein
VQNTIKRWNVDQTKDHCVYRSPSPIQRGFVNYKKGVLDSQPQVIMFTHFEHILVFQKFNFETPFVKSKVGHFDYLLNGKRYTKR